MPLYRVERFVGDITPIEIDAGAYRALLCQNLIEGVRWIRSFYDAEAQRFTCYYEASRPDDLRSHADYAGLPCDSVTEVVEYLPDSYR